MKYVLTFTSDKTVMPIFCRVVEHEIEKEAIKIGNQAALFYHAKLIDFAPIAQWMKVRTIDENSFV